MSMKVKTNAVGFTEGKDYDVIGMTEEQGKPVVKYKVKNDNGDTVELTAAQLTSVEMPPIEPTE